MSESETIQMLTNELHDLTIKYETQENTIRTMELEYKEIEEEVSKLRLQNEELVNKNELLENFKKEMDLEKQMFHSSLMEMEAVNKKNVELHEEISEKKKNIENLNKENTQIKTENKKYIQNMQKYINDRRKQQKTQNDTIEHQQTIEILKLENEDLNQKLNDIITEYNTLNIKFKELNQIQNEETHSDFSDEIQKEQLQNVTVHFSPKIKPTTNRNRIDSDGVPSTVPENQIARSRLDSTGTFASSDGPVLFNELLEHTQHEHDDFGFDAGGQVLEQEDTPVQEEIKSKEIIYDITLDGMYKDLGKNNVIQKTVLDLQSFVENEEFDTDSIIYDVNDDLNVIQIIDYNTLRLIEEYVLKDFKRDILNELKDCRYDALIAQLESIDWTKQQILSILRWLYSEYIQN
eukprot:269075_1